MLQPNSIFLGSYSTPQKKPALYNLNPQKLIIQEIGGDLFNPSFVLCKNDFVYIVEEHDKGALTVINKQYQLIKTVLTDGKDPCHIALHPQNKYISVTNYSGGSFIVYKLKDFIPQDVVLFKKHEGSSTNPDRQQSPHPHSSLFSRDGKILFVADLGTDIVYWYEFEGETLQVKQQKCIRMIGSGPRHLCHGREDQKILFLAGELDSTIRVLSHQNNELELIKCYQISENPKNFPSQITFTNNVVYMACRGDNFMIVLQQKEEEIALVQKLRFKVGDWPRHFKISKAGTIYVACQYENIVQRFKWEGQGVVQLSSFSIKNASCIAFNE